jgi:hypothetical protein
MAFSNGDPDWLNIEEADNCFVSNPTEPVIVVDVNTSNNPTPSSTTSQPRHLRDSASLNSFLTDPNNGRYDHRILSICQKNSWAPLQITKDMLRSIVEHHKIDSSFLEVPLSFFRRSNEQEQGYCVPWTIVRKGSVVGECIQNTGDNQPITYR